MAQEERRRKAVALRYKADEDAAPRIAAKGQGLVADQILKLAKQHNIPIREDRNLLQMLSTSTSTRRFRQQYIKPWRRYWRLFIACPIPKPESNPALVFDAAGGEG
jgi:type III secretion system FlhB-like substrate exporter